MSTPSKIEFIQPAEDDLDDIRKQNPGDEKRILKKIDEWRNFIQWGRSPRKKLTYLTGSPKQYNFYRQWVGRDKYRVIYEISGTTMTVVAVLPKDDHTYDETDFERRMDRYGD